MHELVSIVIPCYNHEKYLDSCIQSIVDQTYDNIELLICDDCSKDSSFEKLLAWKPVLENRFSRVEIYKNEVNQGVCKTLNGLVRKAQGAYIKTLATDDMLTPDAILDYVNFADETEFDIIFSNAYIINEEDRYPVDLSVKRRKYYAEIPPHGMNLTSKLIPANYIHGASLFVRKETYEKYGLYDEQYLYEDWEFLLRVSITGTIAYMDCVPILYRILDGSLSNYNSSSEEGRRKYRIFYEDMKKLLKKYGEYASISDKTIPFNQAIRTAVVLHDHILTDMITKDMKNFGLKVYFGNRIRILALKSGLYNLLRVVKHMAKGKNNQAIYGCKQDCNGV